MFRNPSTLADIVSCFSLPAGTIILNICLWAVSNTNEIGKELIEISGPQAASMKVRQLFVIQHRVVWQKTTDVSTVREILIVLMVEVVYFYETTRSECRDEDCVLKQKSAYGS